ncbi:MAG: phosphoribosylamine--glycine ligase [Candidatus Berkelbacteria bacterium Licking1014_96]|uniref:Phosphoribosylamine--glycine ligase n=1 Tax=Candidatus Berkelbacteria bacterium Licking1014_96 TaxID=2017149 RepID=A0A554LFI5_9BACT|nr:MAG: phosphoribosylamine--glycine ligase [Candidatus Berkelbacteria bacterium Licking1014_96]
MAKVLVIGGGGREHALVWKLAQSPRVDELFVAPGNGGTSDLAENVPIAATDLEGLVGFAKKNGVDLTVVGPDDSLALGIVDVFRQNGLRIFGPTRDAAQIEASKVFAKKLMRRNGIPTAPFQTFRNYDHALSYIRKHGAPIVVKASGLALGKGVYVCQTINEAETALFEIMIRGIHRGAGGEVVIEDFLPGQEISIHAFCDGKTAVLFPTAQDHKPALDGDRGSNTGGMGTVVPLPWVTDETIHVVERQIIQPTLEALCRCGRPFTGCLYPGLKMTSEGPNVLEFNARFGDPETQSYMRLLKTDLLEILEACVEGTLSNLTVKWSASFAACVVLASGGYPGDYKKGLPINGIDEAERIPGVVVFHAGTSCVDGLKTSGGRVLGVTAVADTPSSALSRAYEAVSLIKFEGMHYRHDIGAKALASGP